MRQHYPKRKMLALAFLHVAVHSQWSFLANGPVLTRTGPAVPAFAH